MYKGPINSIIKSEILLIIHAKPLVPDNIILSELFKERQGYSILA
jgi:hypothetical protein